MRKRELPKTMDVLKALPYSERAKLWVKYSSHPFKRQNRSLWYYIQCDRLYCADMPTPDLVVGAMGRLALQKTTT